MKQSLFLGVCIITCGSSYVVKSADTDPTMCPKKTLRKICQDTSVQKFTCTDQHNAPHTYFRDIPACEEQGNKMCPQGEKCSVFCAKQSSGSCKGWFELHVEVQPSPTY